MIEQLVDIGVISGEYLHAVRVRRGMTPSALALVLARHGVIAAGADVEDWETTGVPEKYNAKVAQALNSIFVEADEAGRKAARVQSAPASRAVTFGNSLRSVREQCGVTRAELGAVIGKTDTAIVHYENGDNKINLLDAIDIAEHLGVSLAQLTGETSTAPQPPDELLTAFGRLSASNKKLAIKFMNVLFEHRG